MRSARWAWPAFLLGVSAVACSRQVGTKAILDPTKMSAIVVGRSSEADVLSDLGPPGRVERNGQGESWVYQIEKRDTSGQGIQTGAQVVSAAVGAFVPFGGLVGTGVGLAGTGLSGSQKEPATTTLTIDFGTHGIVRECTVSTNFIPDDTASSVHPDAPHAIDCQRPLPAPSADAVRRENVPIGGGSR